MDILKNPFFTLGVTTRDDRRQIMSMAEEKSLFSDEEIGSEASSTLTNPRKRLAAEVGWLPGVGPRRATEALALIQSNPQAIQYLPNLPPLARANLLAAALVRGFEYIKINDASDWIIELAEAHEAIDVESTMILINEERAVAGFPAVTNSDVIEVEIQQGRRQHYMRAVKDALNTLYSSDLVKVVTKTVETVTEGGKTHAPILIDDLVDSYEVEAQEFLEKEAGNIETLVKRLRITADAEKPFPKLDPLIHQLSKVIKNWDTVAQPIQVSTRSRGMNHNASYQVAALVRGLAIYLTNELKLTGHSRRLTSLLQDVFAEVDKIVDQTTKDLLALDKVESQQTAGVWSHRIEMMDVLYPGVARSGRDSVVRNRWQL
jgi:hypothetical protein